MIQPAPDAYFTVERADKTSYRFFLEVIDPGLPRYVIRKRILDYISYAEGKEWEEKTGHEFPALLCACPNDWVKNYLYRLIKAIQKDEETVNFYLMVYSRSDNKHFWQKVN